MRTFNKKTKPKQPKKKISEKNLENRKRERLMIVLLQNVKVKVRPHGKI